MSKTEPKVAPIPRGFRSITPHVTTMNVGQAVEMYQKGLGAKLISTQKIPDTDTVIFAQIKIGTSNLTIGHGETFGPGSVSLHLYVEDAAATWENTLKAGFTVINPLKERYWGDLTGLLIDPLGVRWSIGQRVVKLTAQTKRTKAKSAMQNASAAANPDTAKTAKKTAPAKKKTK